MTTSQEVLDELHALRLDVSELAGLVRASIAANEPALYCPPSEHCPGGVRLMQHAPKYWKNDGNDADRFYHPLPESAYYKFEGKGAFEGSTVRNHNVWRSEAVREGREDVDHFDPPSSVNAAPASAEPVAFANVGQLLTWAKDALGMSRTDVLRLLQVNAPTDITDLEGAAYTLGSKQTAGARS